MESEGKPIRIIALKGRQQGSSTGIGAYCFLRALCDPLAGLPRGRSRDPGDELLDSGSDYVVPVDPAFPSLLPRFRICLPEA